MLKNNLELYKIKASILNENVLTSKIIKHTKYNIMFLDVPWGGPNYKDEYNITFSLTSP